MKKKILIYKTYLYLCLFALFFTCNVQGQTEFVPRSDLIFQVLDILKKKYIDPDRIKVDAMLISAMKNLSEEIPSVLIELNEEKKEIQIIVNENKNTFNIEGVKDLNSLNSALQYVARFVRQHVQEDLKFKSVEYSLINGSLKALDPHTRLLLPDVYKEFKEETKGFFGGVGMYIGIRDNKLKVIFPIKDTPAYKAGLKAKDYITFINDEATDNLSVRDAVDRLRGKKGTAVKVTIERQGADNAQQYTLIRDIIPIKSISYATFQEQKKRIGYLLIRRFQRNTDDEIAAALKEMDYNFSDFQGLILDVRNNPGGLLSQAIKVSNRFLRSGTIVYTAGINNKITRKHKASWFRSASKIPIVVLINENSASASEILAAALKYNDRAIIIGKQTFGKGSVQQLIGFHDGSAIKYTTSKYLTPGKFSIQSIGITPHIYISDYYITENFVNIHSERKSKKIYENRFNEWGDKVDKPLKSIFYLRNNDIEYQNIAPETTDDKYAQILEGIDTESINKDFLVYLAKNIIIDNTYLKKKKNNFYPSLQNAIEIASTQQKKETRHIKEYLKKLDIHWKTLPKIDSQIPPQIKTKKWLEHKVDDKWELLKGNAAPKSMLRFYMAVENTSKQDIGNIFAITKSNFLYADSREFFFGTLQPQEKKKWFVPITLPQHTIAEDVLINIEVFDENELSLKQEKFNFEITPSQKPRYGFSLQVEEIQGNKDGKITVGEEVQLNVKIKNMSDISSQKIMALLKNGEDEALILKKGKINIETLKKQETQEIYFSFEVKKQPADDLIDILLEIKDNTYKASSLKQKIRLPYNKKISHITNQAPQITFQKYPLTISQNTYLLKGNLQDNQQLEDMYVLHNDKKIYYKNFLQKKVKKIPFQLDLQLQKGANLITVFVRDDNKVVSSKEINIRREN